jgi:hypothetical protein
MFCPKCGSNQGEGRRFCTVCGTNLAAVSQALTGQIPQPNYYSAPIPHPLELERLEAQRQRAMAKGVRLSIIGGGIVALKFFSFIFSGPFRGGSPFGFWTFIGFVLLAIGISKIITSRPPSAVNSPAPAPNQTQTHSSQQANPHPVFSAPTSVGQSVPQTSELEPVGRYTQSATEDETRHLPHSKPPHEISR